MMTNQPPEWVKQCQAFLAGAAQVVGRLASQSHGCDLMISVGKDGKGLAVITVTPGVRITMDIKPQTALLVPSAPISEEAVLQLRQEIDAVINGPNLRSSQE